MPRLLLIVALVAASGLVRVTAQTYHGGVEVVTVNATVTDANGRIVTGLKQSDFVVYEDGVPQPITAFTAERVPVSLGILLDMSDSMYGARWADAIRAVDRFVTELLKPGDETFLMAFNHAPQLVAPWSKDPTNLRARLGELTPSGGTALYDALIASVPALKRREHQRAAVLAISDGADTSSDTPLAATVTALGETEAFVYAITIDPPDRAPINAGAQPEALRALTGPTGGYTDVIRDSTELAAATARFADELNSQYTIGFSPSHGADGQYHTLLVRVPGGKHFIRARRGYVATPTRRK